VSFICLSCIGTVSDITLRDNGSGSVKLQYRVAKQLEETGRLDGNAKWLPVPVGRADMERTVRRIEGLKLAAFSSKSEGNDTVYSYTLNFADTGALTAFFGSSLAISMAEKKFTLAFPGDGIGAEMGEMLTESLSGYDFSLTVKFPATPSLRWTGSAGPGEFEIRGQTLHYGAPMAALVLLEKSAIMEISW
jgi:hypothetical protein